MIYTSGYKSGTLNMKQRAFSQAYRAGKLLIITVVSNYKFLTEKEKSNPNQYFHHTTF